MAMTRQFVEERAMQELRLDALSIRLNVSPQLDQLRQVIDRFAKQGAPIAPPSQTIIDDFNNIVTDWKNDPAILSGAALTALQAHTEAYGQSVSAQEQVFAQAHERLQSMRADFSKGRGNATFVGLITAQNEGRAVHTGHKLS